jgi:hypothetical protein
MKKSGHLDMATDHFGYAQWIAHLLSHTPYFENRNPTPYQTWDSERIRTKYEQNALDGGRTCFYFKWIRNEVENSNDYPIPEEKPMPHVSIDSRLTLDEIGRNFEQAHHTMGMTSIRFIEIFRSLERPSLMIDTYINEKPISQRVLLAITCRKEGDLLIHMHEIGFPRSTTGAHLAINSLVNWLCTLDPTCKIKTHNLKISE